VAERSAWADFDIALLARSHDRTTFSCGKAPLDEYLKKHSRQNDDKGLTRTFVLLERSSNIVSGYYTVRYGQVNFEQLPEAERKGLPRYSVPTFHIARLAVDEKYRGQGKRLGEFLLTDALRRALAASEQAGLYAIEVVAKDDDASAFYTRYQFRGLIDDTMHMYLPMSVVKKMFVP
jgi:GNAT superfamily N-acetyltransferase